MKKSLALIVSLALVAALVSGCAANPPVTTTTPTLAPTAAPTIKPAVTGEIPNTSPLPDIVDPLVPDINPDISPEINPEASPGVSPIPELSPSVSPGTSPEATPQNSPGTPSPSPSVSPGNTGASIPEAPSSDIETMTDASEIASAAAEQQNVQRAIAVQFEHTCIVGLTLNTGKKYNQATEDAVLAAVRKKNDSIAYFITADKNEVQILKQILDSWDQEKNANENKYKFADLAQKLKEATESKAKQS